MLSGTSPRILRFAQNDTLVSVTLSGAKGLTSSPYWRSFPQAGTCRIINAFPTAFLWPVYTRRL